MKNLLVRAFAFTLIASGAVASAHLVGTSSHAVHIGTSAAAVPVAVCPPDDPNGCYMGSKGN